MDFPASLKYTKDHECIDSTSGTAKVGVTSYAVEQLGDIVHIELPKVGDTFAQGAPFGTIESTKTVSDLYLPVAGKIVAVNGAALSAPESLQDDSYENGWLVKVEITSPANDLLDAAAYQKFVSENAD